jgi:hypothetical protein
MQATAALNDLNEHGGSVSQWLGEYLQQHTLIVLIDQHTQPCSLCPLLITQHTILQ